MGRSVGRSARSEKSSIYREGGLGGAFGLRLIEIQNRADERPLLLPTLARLFANGGSFGTVGRKN
jgi:hypothetical protein